MKTTQRFLTLLFLLGHVSAYAMVPCDGPCSTPRPDMKCRKKVNACKVDTDTLLVRKNANVCGDLTVNGTINNLELQLLLDSNVPPTDEVYNQYLIAPNVYPILENIQDFSFSLNNVAPGTEIYPDAPVYGYTTTGTVQELMLDGGPESTYTPGFETVNLKYHGTNPAEIAVTSPNYIESVYQHAISYFAQRGFSLPGIDVYPQYEGQFSYQSDIDQAVCVKFQYADEASILPYALDLAANADFVNFYLSLGLYEPNIELRQQGKFYPIRIPITTNINEFKQLYCTQPIAYYNTLHRQITIHVPEDMYECYRLLLELCDAYTDQLSYLNSFDGTFNIMRRNANNQMVSSSFREAEYLIQASSQVSVSSKTIAYGEPSFFLDVYNFYDEGGVFNGLAIPLMNGGSTAFDLYTYAGVVSAFTAYTNPLILPALELEGYSQGDNPSTILVEHLASPSNCTIFDNIDWYTDVYGFPASVMMGLTTPEENEFVPEPMTLDSAKVLYRVLGHELFHTTQFLQVGSSAIPSEGQALSIELDAKLNDNTYSKYPLSRWTLYTSTAVRGDWPLTLPEVTAQNQGFNTYGSSIFWKYMASHFDYNYQSMRRMNDIIGHETLNPLLQENGIPNEIVGAYIFLIGTNPAGSLCALQQAVQELHGLNLQEVFSNYSISLALLRNNTSIPEEYRHSYPYWLASDTYPWHEQISRFPLWATWWQDYQENIIIPEGYTLPQYTGQNFVPILDQDINQYPMQDMTMLIFEVPDNVTSVTVDVTGEWRISAVQFTSDGTPVGQFIIDGPNVNVDGQTIINMAQFTGTGSVRLVCAHVSMPTYQGLASFCGEGEFTGTISITRN